MGVRRDRMLCVGDSQRTALVLSGGGLFGAWQVGAWGVLSRYCKFDVVIGASIGALNGWAIAGGATPEEMESRWMDVSRRGRLRFRFPSRPLDGFVDFSLLEGFIKEIHTAYRPKTDYRLVITELARLKPRVVDGSQVQWRHLAASCALLGLLPQQRIERTLYTDGGLLGALPMWVVRHCHVDRAVGLNVMPRMPWAVRAVLKPIAARRNRNMAASRDEAAILKPSVPLGNWHRGLSFHPEHIGEWLAQGRRDAEAAVAEARSGKGNISLRKCFVAE